jgi:hypothetical protein
MLRGLLLGTGSGADQLVRRTLRLTPGPALPLHTAVHHGQAAACCVTFFTGPKKVCCAAFFTTRPWI